MPYGINSSSFWRHSIPSKEVRISVFGKHRTSRARDCTHVEEVDGSITIDRAECIQLYPPGKLCNVGMIRFAFDVVTVGLHDERFRES